MTAPRTSMLLVITALAALSSGEANARGAHSHTHGALEAAVAAGELSPLEAHRLTFLAARAPEALPDAWAPLANRPHPCLTPSIRAIQQHLSDFPADEQAQLRALFDPPLSGAYLQSDRYPLRVHYPGDADRATAARALGILEESWAVEVDEMGFWAPLGDGGFAGSDDLDVFILPGSGGAGAVGLDPNPRTSWNDWSTYITLDPEDYGGDLMGVTLAHEFNHSCQAAYDWYETSVALESTATFVEDRVFDEVNDYYTYLDAFQSRPHKPVDFAGGTFAWYVYAASLFQHIIAERYGDAVIPEMWVHSRQRGYRNEPDFIDGLEAALAPQGATFAMAAREVAHWRYFIGSRDDGAHLSEAAAMGDSNQVYLEGQYTTQTLPRGEILLQNPPAETAANLFEIDVAATHQSRILQWQFQGDDRVDWAVDILAIPPEGAATIIEGELNAAQGDVSLAGFERVVVVVVNMGDGHHDPESREWGGMGYDLSLELAPAAAPRLKERR